jgi:hypothetical protein
MAEIKSCKVNCFEKIGGSGHRPWKKKTEAKKR